MKQRLDYANHTPEPFSKLFQLPYPVEGGDVDVSILTLAAIRASHINSCAFCLDVKAKEPEIHGELDLRPHHIAGWRESSFFNDRDRAALEWTEALTGLTPLGMSEDLYKRTREHFHERELSTLTSQVLVINSSNRAGIAFRALPGSADKIFGLCQANLSDVAEIPGDGIGA